MKFMKWKILVLTCLVCLLPIFLGVALWNELPEEMAIHFNIYGEPDNFASKSFGVFGLPAMMALLQVFCCFINDFNANKHGDRKKFEMVTKWIIPVMAIVLQIALLGYSIGWAVDARRVATVIVGGVFLVIGNYMPKFAEIKHYDVETQKARKINRFIGFETVVMGILFLLSLFFPPVATVICLILLIPYAGISIIYGIKVGKGK